MRNFIKIIEGFLSGSNLPMDTTVQQDKDTLDDEAIFEMANLGPAQTGIPQGVIFISTAMGKHGPRVKYMLKPSGNAQSFSMSISDDAEVVANSLPAKIKNKVEPYVRQFVISNKDTLLNFWKHGDEMSHEQYVDMVNSFIKYGQV